MAKPQPKLSHMPRHVKETIVDDADTDTKLSLRQTDREFKEIADDSRIHYEKLGLFLNTDIVRVYWYKTKKELVEQIFKPEGDGYAVRQWKVPMKTGEGDYRKAAVAKMLSVFKNPKITVGELVMEVAFGNDHTGQRFEADRTAIFEEIERNLPLKNFRLRVEKLHIYFRIEGHMLLSVLSLLESGILKVLHVSHSWLDDWNPLERPTIDPRIADMEQWKQLREVKIDSFCFDIPIEKYMHLEKIELNLSRRPTETVKTILEKLLQKPTMKECILRNSNYNDGFDKTGVQEYMDQLEEIPDDDDNFKHPYEAGKRVMIYIGIFSIKITKSSD